MYKKAEKIELNFDLKREKMYIYWHQWTCYSFNKHKSTININNSHNHNNKLYAPR